jgi:predicted alpha/beta superfamily hydrolase
MKQIAFFALTILMFGGNALSEPLEIKSEGVVTYQSQQQLVLRSKTLGRDFLVRIAPPLMPTRDGTKPAAVYLLDANALFGMASDTFRFQSMEGKSPATYIVAIGYDTSNPMVVMQARETDFLHSSHKADGKPAIGGGGLAFETFLVDELKPFIEARYNIDPKRSVLAGVSYGGLFVANVLANRPGAFSGYMIGSPSVWADSGAIERVKKTRADPRTKVFIGVGEKEVTDAINMVQDAKRLGAALTGVGYAVSHRIYIDQVHAAVPGPWLADGFRYLLSVD